jgi:hypothetical protein
MRFLPSWARLGLCARDTQATRRDCQMQEEIGFYPSEIVLGVLTAAWKPWHCWRRFFGLAQNAQQACVGVKSRVQVLGLH